MIKTDLDGIYLAAYEKTNDKELDIDVCLINTLDEPKTLLYQQGSFADDMDGVMSLGHSGYEEIVVPPLGYLKIDHFSDEGQLDFTTFYNFKVGDKTYLEHVSGRCFYDDRVVDIPVINVKAI